jgi:hypothetical protein
LQTNQKYRFVESKAVLFTCCHSAVVQQR